MTRSKSWQKIKAIHCAVQRTSRKKALRIEKNCDCTSTRLHI